MTSLLRLLDVQVGLGADVNDFTAKPGTYKRVQVIGGGESLMPRRFTELSRNDIAALDGRGFTHLTGPLDLADCAPVTEMKGVDSNTGAAVTSSGWYAKLEQGELMTSMLGSEPIATTGAAPTIAASGHTTTTVVFVGTAPVVGELFLFQTNLGPRIRAVQSVTTLTATVAAYTGTPTSGSTVIRACRWAWSPATPNHKHIGIKAEIPDVMAEFIGCAPVSLALAVPTGGKVQATWTLSPTDVDGFQAQASPTITYPAAGAPIVALNSELIIGGESFVFDSLAVSCATGNEPRTTPASRNGRLGGIAANKRDAFTITGSIRLEPRARGGIERNTGVETLRAILGDTVSANGPAVTAERDVLLVIGRAAGAAMAIRLDNADLTAAMATVGTVAAVSFTATATRSASIGLF